MKKMLMMLSVLLLSVSCVDLNGTLQVQQPLTVKMKSGFLGLKTKTRTLAPGAHQARLVVKSSKNIKLELGDQDIPIKSDDSLNIPQNGQFYIDARKIEQPFSVAGNMRTDVEHYGWTDTTERCERNIVENRCEKVCARDSNRCDVVCKDVTITLYGIKDISYHYKRTDRQVSLEIMPENSTAIVARMVSRGIETDKIIDRESICR